MGSAHEERMKEKNRGLKRLIEAMKDKPIAKQDLAMIEEWENQIEGLEGQLRGGR